MDVARRLYALSHAQSSGALRLTIASHPRFSASVYLDHGWIHALSAGHVAELRAPLSPDRELALVELLSLSAHGLAVAFSADAPKPITGSCTPFHPGRALRAHADALRLSASWPQNTRVRLTAPPHASLLDEDERILCAALAREYALAELDGMRLCLPSRARRLLAFLAAVDALAVAPPRDDLTRLGLTGGATLDEIRAAWRRLAREHHPDLNPSASREVFVAIHAAYRRLTGEE